MSAFLQTLGKMLRISDEYLEDGVPDFFPFLLSRNVRILVYGSIFSRYWQNALNSAKDLAKKRFFSPQESFLY